MDSDQPTYIPTHSTNLCNVFELLFWYDSFELTKTKRQRRISYVVHSH